MDIRKNETGHPDHYSCRRAVPIPMGRMIRGVGGPKGKHGFKNAAWRCLRCKPSGERVPRDSEEKGRGFGKSSWRGRGRNDGLDEGCSTNQGQGPFQCECHWCGNVGVIAMRRKAAQKGQTWACSME